MSGYNQLDRTTDNLRKLLLAAINNNLSHKELADWCYEYCNDYWNCLDKEDEKEYQNDKVLNVAMDIDTQWELYLDNTYTIDELQTIDFREVNMPQEWLMKWMKELT